MNIVHNWLMLPFENTQLSLEDEKRLGLDQAIQMFTSHVDPSLNSTREIKNFIYSDYMKAPLFRAENAEVVHEAVENYLMAEADYLAVASS
ncbi:hypothetical protein [Simkania sp.]|uniref:hypothetical protein n=1 Tax=Simkania sp. TaxID=34094 RepID=UPI003B521B42